MGEAPDQLKPDRLILVGRVAGAFGVKGELRLTAYTADPLALFAYRTLLDRSGQPKLTLVSARAAKGDVICRTQEPFTKEEADALRGTQLFVPRSALPPPEEEEFYHADLIGLVARTEDGEVLGRIKAVHDFGAGDILEIDPGGGKAALYHPFTKAATPEVNLAGGYVVVVKLPEINGDAPE